MHQLFLQIRNSYPMNFWKAAVLKMLVKSKHLRIPLKHRRKFLFLVKLSSALNVNSTKN